MRQAFTNFMVLPLALRLPRTLNNATVVLPADNLVLTINGGYETRFICNA